LISDQQKSREATLGIFLLFHNAARLKLPRHLMLAITRAGLDIVSADLNKMLHELFPILLGDLPMRAFICGLPQVGEEKIRQWKDAPGS